MKDGRYSNQLCDKKSDVYDIVIVLEIYNKFVSIVFLLHNVRNENAYKVEWWSLKLFWENAAIMIFFD